MSETTRVTSHGSPAKGDQANEGAGSKVGVIFFAMMWIAIFAYGVYIKTI